MKLDEAAMFRRVRGDWQSQTEVPRYVFAVKLYTDIHPVHTKRYTKTKYESTWVGCTRTHIHTHYWPTVPANFRSTKPAYARHRLAQCQLRLHDKPRIGFFNSETTLPSTFHHRKNMNQLRSAHSRWSVSSASQTPRIVFITRWAPVCRHRSKASRTSIQQVRRARERERGSEYIAVERERGTEHSIEIHHRFHLERSCTLGNVCVCVFICANGKTVRANTD